MKTTNKTGTHSKSNPFNIGLSVEHPNNDRLLALRRILLEKIPRQVPFADLAWSLHVIALCHAAKDNTDGDFSGVHPDTWRRMFCNSNQTVSEKEGQIIYQA